MHGALGWVSLILMLYITIALFFVFGGTQKVLRIASAKGELQSDASSVLTQSPRTRFLWVKKHREQLPTEARELAARVVAIDLSCCIAVVMLLIIYGLQFIAP